MAVEVMAGLGALTNLYTLAKGLNDISDATALNAAVIELQGTILEAQDQRMTMVTRVAELEEKLTRFDTWDAEKKRYSLMECDTGTFAYILRKSEAQNEPGHAICPTCYERGCLRTDGRGVR